MIVDQQELERHLCPNYHYTAIRSFRDRPFNELPLRHKVLMLIWDRYYGPDLQGWIKTDRILTTDRRGFRGRVRALIARADYEFMS